MLWCLRLTRGSFAIVMWELWTRLTPFEEQRSVWDVRDAVEAGVRPAVPDDAPGSYTALMVRCWDGSPAVRATFAECVRLLEVLFAETPHN